MPELNHAHREQKALRISLYGVIFFIVLALGFAVYTQSDAILFDGIYSLIAFATVLITMKVAKLVERPNDEQFHFGYAALEPTLNLFKSLVVIIACCYAGVEAFKRLLVGGTEAAYGWAVIYGVIATLGCFMVAAIMRKMGDDSRSDLLNVESKTWFVDGLLSASVLVGFIIAWLLAQTPYKAYAPYVDPVLLIALVCFAIPIPGRILIDSLKEVIDMAPAADVVDEIEQQLKMSLATIKISSIEFRVSKRGRNTYLLVHIIVAENFVVNSIAELDTIRRNCLAHMKAWKPEIVMDILFVEDHSFTI